MKSNSSLKNFEEKISPPPEKKYFPPLEKVGKLRYIIMKAKVYEIFEELPSYKIRIVL